MTQVYALWHGGPSYVHSEPPRDVEVFGSIRAAKDAFDSRYRLGYTFRQHFEFINQEPQDVLCPCVEYEYWNGEYWGTEMWLFFEDPSDWGDIYPDRILKFGPRGGIVEEKV